MVANMNIIQNAIQNQKGQSILEITLLIPFLVLFMVLLYKMNMAAQISINNTQFARSQIYILTANSPEYPRLQFRGKGSTIFGDNKQNRMVLGVTSPEALETANRAESTFEPIPQTQTISRARTKVKGSGERGEQTLRNVIRVRNTSAICTQLNSAGKSVMNSESILGILAQRWPFGDAVCKYEGIGNGDAHEGD